MCRRTRDTSHMMYTSGSYDSEDSQRYPVLLGCNQCAGGLGTPGHMMYTGSYDNKDSQRYPVLLGCNQCAGGLGTPAT